jgi:hypothetical protein
VRRHAAVLCTAERLAAVTDGQVWISSAWFARCKTPHVHCSLDAWLPGSTMRARPMSAILAVRARVSSTLRLFRSPCITCHNKRSGVVKCRQHQRCCVALEERPAA